MKWPDCSQTPCGDTWQDCPWYDPDICLDESKCLLEDAVLWGDNYYNEDDAPWNVISDFPLRPITKI